MKVFYHHSPASIQANTVWFYRGEKRRKWEEASQVVFGLFENWNKVVGVCSSDLLPSVCYWVLPVVLWPWVLNLISTVIHVIGQDLESYTAAIIYPCLSYFAKFQPSHLKEQLRSLTPCQYFKEVFGQFLQGIKVIRRERARTRFLLTPLI